MAIFSTSKKKKELSASDSSTQNRQSAIPNQTILYPWAQRPITLVTNSENPFPRYGHSVNSIASIPNGDLYIFGGLVKNQVKNDLFRIQGSNSSSSISLGLIETKGEIPGPRVGHCSVGVGNVLIIWGGDTKTKPDQIQDSALYLLNLTTKEWTKVKTIGPVPEGRYGHAAAMVGSKFWIFGGQNDGGGFMNDLSWFDLTKLKTGSPKWTFVDYSPDSIAPPKRTGHTTITHGDCIYIFGGTDGQYHYNDTWCYDTTTQLWSELSCIGYIPVPREGHAATLVDDVMYVFGGRGVDGKDLEDLAAFKITNQRWFMFQNMGPAPSGRSGHAMATFQNKVFVLGGESYTSQRADDPNFIHVLDTSKIKYPQDSSRTPQQLAKKSSIPTLSSSIPTPVSSSHPLPSAPPLVNQQPLPQTIEERERTTSPNESNRSIPPQQSFGSLNSEATSTRGPPPPAASRIAKRSISGSGSSITPPARPARPDVRPENRVEEPAAAIAVEARRFAPQPPILEALSNSPPTNFARETARETESENPASTASQSKGIDAVAYRSNNGNEVLERQDGFYYGGNNSNGNAGINNGNFKSNSNNRGQMEPLNEKLVQELEEFKAREKWMKVLLEKARKRGFSDYSEQEQLELGELESSKENEAVVRALIAMKQELAKAKSGLAEQAEFANEKISTSSQARLVALQEAGFYRAKLSALESGSTSDVSRLEKERIAELEKKLSEVSLEKETLEERVEKLESETDGHLANRALAEERGTSATSRADAVENSYSKSLSDYAELQRSTHLNQSKLSDHQEKMNILSTDHKSLSIANSNLKSALEEKDSLLSGYLETLEATRLALSAAQTRNEETHSIWEKSNQELLEHQTRSRELATELDGLRQDRDSATNKATDLERILNATREEHEANKSLVEGKLQELIAGHHEAIKSREVTNLGHAEKTRAMAEEVDGYKVSHLETRNRLELLQAELAESRSREIELQTQLISTRSEISNLRAENSKALSEVNLHKSVADERSSDLRSSTKTREVAEIKSNLLKSLLVENGISVNDGEVKTRDLNQNGSLQERVEMLERELENERNGAGSSAAQELESLQVRHRTLEGTHLKAVQYVKGTEKMLRRMKDELTRYKERNTELEAEIIESDGALPANVKLELESLHSQLMELRTTSESYANENDSLQLQIAKISSESERLILEREQEEDEKVQRYEQEIEKLDADLDKAQIELDEALETNKELNLELTNALKKNGSKGFASGGLDGDIEKAQGRANWLQRENQALELRCKAAEEKISILLDHMEGNSEASDVNYQDHSGLNSHSNNHWQRGLNDKSGPSDVDIHSDYSDRAVHN